jgi:hypothetical protein
MVWTSLNVARSFMCGRAEAFLALYHHSPAGRAHAFGITPKLIRFLSAAVVHVLNLGS